MASGSAGDRPLRPIWNVDERALQVFMERMQQPPDSAQWFALRRAAERLALVPGFDSLITLDSNTIKELPHQIDVALRVLRQMGGRAILADEVGLGKTIEAGIVLKELAVRGLARRILILTPAALVDQWCEATPGSHSSYAVGPRHSGRSTQGQESPGQHSSIRRQNTTELHPPADGDSSPERPPRAVQPRDASAAGSAWNMARLFASLSHEW